MGFTALKIFKMYKYPYTEMMRYINPQRKKYILEVPFSTTSLYLVFHKPLFRGLPLIVWERVLIPFCYLISPILNTKPGSLSSISLDFWPHKQKYQIGCKNHSGRNTLVYVFKQWIDHNYIKTKLFVHLQLGITTSVDWLS